MVYGPGDPLHRLLPILKCIEEDRPILLEEGMAQWRGSRGYVENVAAAIAAATASERAAGRIYNVAEPESFSEFEWTCRVAEAAGWNGRILTVKGEAAFNTAQHWTADSTRIRNELGYREPVPVEEALRRTIEWERASCGAGPRPAAAS
jgi:nucleoside-diphosphate-sugar epimerase